MLRVLDRHSDQVGVVRNVGNDGGVNFAQARAKRITDGTAGLHDVAAGRALRAERIRNGQVERLRGVDVSVPQQDRGLRAGELSQGLGGVAEAKGKGVGSNDRGGISNRQNGRRSRGGDWWWLARRQAG